jgi:hypothetical protein
MKKIAIASLFCLVAAGAYAQGTLIFYNTFGNMDFQIYSPQGNGLVQQGDTAAQIAIDGSSNLSGDGENTTPVTYSGVPIGGSLDASPSSTLPPSSINYAAGNDFTAQIYALAAGQNSVAFSSPIPAFSSLSPISQYIENFTTTGGSANANLSNVNPPNDPGIPGTGESGTGRSAVALNNAFVAVAAWYNAGGTITSLSQAISDKVPEGNSAVVLVTGLGEPSSVETALNNGTTTAASQPAVPLYLESFSLGNPTTTPEPGTIALGVMGVCGFLARRRKK